MISRSHRFHGHASLGYVYGKGRVIRGALHAVKYVRNDRRSTYRLAVVVSKKVSKSAVVRNRIRRKTYEVVRSFEGDIREPYDIVITVFAEQVARTPNEALRSLLRDQFIEAGIVADTGPPKKDS